MTIKNRIELLERSYKEFFDEDHVRDFFLGLVDYLGLLESFPEYTDIKKFIYAEKKSDEIWDIKNSFDVKRHVELWCELEKLDLIRKIVKSQIDGKASPYSAVWDTLAYGAVTEEWKRMRTGQVDYSIPIIFFDRQATEPVVRRLHRHVIAKLSELVVDPKEQTVICINEGDCSLCKKTDQVLKCQFRSQGGSNRRFKYIMEIARSNNGVSGEGLYPGHLQALSTEIANINERILNDLKLTKSFIINISNTGYRINDVYGIEFV